MKRNFFQNIFFNILAEKGNFKAIHAENSTNTIGNVFLSGFINLQPNLLPIHTTSTFTSFTLQFLTTPGVLYTSYEKLLMPFDKTTWFLLIITFCISFVVIIITKLLPRAFQTVIIGSNIKSPGLNVISIFFGIAQIRVPNSEFSRFLFILFIFFCLIIRTAYQGLLFELMTSDKHKPTPKTIHQLIDMDYKVYGIKVLDYYDGWFEDGMK